MLYLGALHSITFIKSTKDAFVFQAIAVRVKTKDTLLRFLSKLSFAYQENIANNVRMSCIYFDKVIKLDIRAPQLWSLNISLYITKMYFSYFSVTMFLFVFNDYI